MTSPREYTPAQLSAFEWLRDDGMLCGQRSVTSTQCLLALERRGIARRGDGLMWGLTLAGQAEKTRLKPGAVLLMC